MTLDQLIDALSNTAGVIGGQAVVRAWHVDAGTGTGALPLVRFETTGVSAGWDASAQQPLAIIKIARGAGG